MAPCGSLTLGRFGAALLRLATVLGSTQEALLHIHCLSQVQAMCVHASSPQLLCTTLRVSDSPQ
eukprot:4712696-Amphidinium_carterae.2